MGDLIQRPDLIYRLQQFLGLRHRQVAPRIADELVPVVIMGDVREVGTEKAISRPCVGIAEVDDSAAGTHMVAVLRNPAGSNVVLRTESVEVREPTSPGSGARVLLQPISFVNGNMGAFFRNLVALGPLPVGEIDFQANVIAFPTAQAFIDNPRTMVIPWTIYPGFELRVDSMKTTATGVGVFVRFWFAWTESTVGAS